MAAKILHLLVTDADHVLEMLPEVGLSGARMEDEPEGQVVKIVATGDNNAEDLWFELSWHADKLGIISGRFVEQADS
ncbi:hypothetical protein SEA_VALENTINIPUFF_42 [Microbacterium phage ValentiniPuff]|uniref:Uncharacterized protein n=1 Tax=Microbacterium phage ValentiniPuff TaxID=2315705 RepID=A0A386KRY0_9CAUD|nr:hypothetical protein SEA_VALENTINIPUFF_42 [Microbacterium phage ValentiniPuff]